MAELLAIDLGTMSAKVGVFARDGRLVGFARHPYPLEHPGPECWVEQQSEQWWTAVQGAIHEALRGHSTRTS